MVDKTQKSGNLSSESFGKYGILYHSGQYTTHATLTDARAQFVNNKENVYNIFERNEKSQWVIGHWM